MTTDGLSGEESRAWNKIVRELVKLYKKVAGVARTHGPHVQAYGAALATPYRLELAAIASDPERACDKPEPFAMSTRRSDSLRIKQTHAFKWEPSSCPSSYDTCWRKLRKAESVV
jgi:hypothetical protein